MVSTGDRLFAILWSVGERWTPGVPVTEQDLHAHRAYWAGLSARGGVVVAGPFLDAEAGGMAVFEAATLEDAREIMLRDPAVATKVFSGRVRPLCVVFPEAPAGEPD
jgi:uncharacterized protein YciI